MNYQNTSKELIVKYTKELKFPALRCFRLSAPGVLPGLYLVQLLRTAWKTL